MYRPSFPLVAVSQVAVGQVDVQMTTKSSSPSQTSPLPTGPALCEDGRPYITDPVTGRKVCACNLGSEIPFDPRCLLPDVRKQGIALTETVAGTAIGIDTSAFYSPLIRGIPTARHDRLNPFLTSAMPGQSVPFDPTLAAHPYGLLYAGMDVNGGPIRKAATRETTGPLKIWLSEHKKNPYPTKAEKIMLAIITRMTLTQVSTWFANARRRLKKENKLYCADRENGPDDDDDDDDEDYNDNQKDGSRSQSSGTEKKLDADSDTEDINVDLSDSSDDEDPNTCNPDLKNLRRGRSDTEDASSEFRLRDEHLFKRGKNFNERHKIGRQFGLSESVPATGPAMSPSGANLSTTCTAMSPTCAVPDRPKIWSVSDIIRGPSLADDRERSILKSSTTPQQSGSILPLSKHFTSLSTLSSLQQQPPSTAQTQSAISSSPSFSLSSVPSSLSPTAFRPVHPLMGVPPLFVYRPELVSCINRYGLPIAANGLSLDRHSSPPVSSHQVLVGEHPEGNSKKVTTKSISPKVNYEKSFSDSNLEDQEKHTPTDGRLKPDRCFSLTLHLADSSSFTSRETSTSSKSEQSYTRTACTEPHKFATTKVKPENSSKCNPRTESYGKCSPRNENRNDELVEEVSADL